MKKFQKTIALAALLVLVLTMALCACDNGTAAATVVETAEKYVVIRAEKTGGSLEDAMAQLQSDGKLQYETTIGQYGATLQSVNGYSPDSSKYEFWAIYTTLTEYEGVSYSDVNWGTFEYDGKTLGSASYGASGMPMIEGHLYVLAISTY